MITDTYSKGHKLWSNTIKEALLADNGKKLTEITDKITTKLIEGEDIYARDIAERLNGKLKKISLNLGINLEK